MARRKSDRKTRKEHHDQVDKVEAWTVGIRYKSQAFPPEQRKAAPKHNPRRANLNRRIL